LMPSLLAQEVIPISASLPEFMDSGVSRVCGRGGQRLSRGGWL
jgi:hypothetical protein